MCNTRKMCNMFMCTIGAICAIPVYANADQCLSGKVSMISLQSHRFRCVCPLWQILGKIGY